MRCLKRFGSGYPAKNPLINPSEAQIWTKTHRVCAFYSKLTSTEDQRALVASEV